jgi:hypothetical protein
MRCARASPRNFTAARAFRRWHLGLTFFLLLLGSITRAIPAAAQGGPETLPGAGGGPAAGGPETPTVTGGAPAVQPALPGGGPDILPLVPGGGFGFPNPLNPPTATNNAAPPVATIAPTSPLGLSPLGFGVVPLQANDPTAPAYLIRSYASISETLTDNVNYVHAPRDAAAYTNLAPGLSISADTPRLQAVLSGNLNTAFYIPSSSNLDQVYGSLYASGFGTVVPDALFVDLTSVVTQSTPLPGFGFQNLSRLPTNQQTQVYSTTVSPFFRHSFDGLVDTQLQYTFNSTTFGGNTRVVATPLSTPTNLASSISNEGTFIAATGQNFSRTLARLTLDASNFDSGSTNQSSQLSGFTDLEYRIAPQAAALARIGYQSIQFPFAPAATFVGPTWLVGGAIGTYGSGPGGPGYFSLEYGRQQGVLGFTGSARYNITPTMLFTASLVQGLGSPGQDIGSTLATSTLDPNGSIVDEYSGLPVAFYSPGVGLTNNPYRQHLLNFGVTDAIGLNNYSLYGYLANQQSLTPLTSAPTTVTSAPTKSIGVNFTWTRNVRPDLNGYASLGYFNSSNLITTTGGAPASSLNTITAYLGVNYSFAQNLTGSILYSFSYQSNGGGGAVGRSTDVVVNQLTFQLSKTF